MASLIIVILFCHSYFTRYNIPKDARNCELATMYNFICGCEGPGYMKANSEAKRNSLVWLPRVTSIFSFFVSDDDFNFILTFVVVATHFSTLFLFFRDLQ